MSRTQVLIVAFWLGIVGMLIYQFYNYNESLSQTAIDNTPQQHFYFFHTNAPAAAAPVAPRNGADVVQTKFEVQPNTPENGSFTCLVTLKNVGNQKATGVQISVRPYRGVSNVDIDVGQERGGVLPEDDPISQYNAWVDFPDLAPGESSTQSVNFLNRNDYSPGINPDPEIIFQSVKPASPPMAHPAPNP